MIFKLLLTTILFVAQAKAQSGPWDDGFASDKDYETPIQKRCNVTFCYIPCEGAAPPPTCPENIPDCPSGCACFMDCSNNVETCFMTAHCTKIRRFFTKRRHVRSLSQNQSSVVSELHPETLIDLTSSIISNQTMTRTETIKQNFSSSIDTDDFEHPSPVAQTMSQITDTLESITPQDVVGRVERDMPSSHESQNISEIIVSSTLVEAQGMSERETDVTSATVGRVERDLQEPRANQAEHDSVGSALHPTVLAHYDVIPETESDENIQKPPLPFLSNYQTGLMVNVKADSEDEISQFKANVATKLVYEIVFDFILFGNFCRFIQLLCT